MSDENDKTQPTQDPPDYSQMDYFPVQGRLTEDHSPYLGATEVVGNQVQAVNCEYIINECQVPIRWNDGELYKNKALDHHQE